MEGTKDFIPGGIVNQLLFMMALQLVTGIIGIIGLLTLRHIYKSDYDVMFNKHLKFPYMLLILPALIQISYLLFNMKALAEGGSVAMAIINMNTFVTILLGTLVFKDKINTEVTTSLIVSVIAGIYAVYKQEQLH